MPRYYFRPPSLLTNRVPDTPFRPLDSAVKGAKKPAFFEQWKANVPPKVLGPRVRIVESGSTVYRTQDWRGLSQVTLPYPMPCAVFTTCWRDGEDAVAPNLPNLIYPDRRPFLVINDLAWPTIPSHQGVIMIEWGVGESRNYMLLDMAQHSVNIPLASWIRVSAQICRVAGFPAVVPPAVIANASIIPNLLYPYPYATLSTSVFVTDSVSTNIEKMPHAREFSVHLYSDIATAYLDIQMSTRRNPPTIINGAPVARYQFYPSLPGNPNTRPYPLSRLPMPMEADNIFLDMVTGGLPGDLTFEFQQIIEP